MADEILRKNSVGGIAIVEEPCDLPVEHAYAFHLDYCHKRHLYFRTVSLWAGTFSGHGRDVRRADPVIAKNFEIVMKAIGQPFRWARHDERLADLIGGWVLVPIDVANRRFAPFLENRTCLKSPLGLFWDIAIPRGSVMTNRTESVRQAVLARDGHRCVECGCTESNDADLTMDHVIPFSRGGETTEWNLVTLCKQCNQGHGNRAHSHLFALAGLHSGYDPALLKGEITQDAKAYATMLSQNILVCRCPKSSF